MSFRLGARVAELLPARSCVRRLSRYTALRQATVSALFCGALAACARQPAQTPTAPLTKAAVVPARLRLLSNAELEASLSAVLLTPLSVAAALPLEVRQSGYSRNAERSWNAGFARQWDSATSAAVEQATQRDVRALWPCVGAGAGTAKPNESETCVSRQVAALGLRAWRRPLTAQEVQELQALYVQTVKQSDSLQGLRTLLRALLQAPSFVYASEIGQPRGPGARYLDDFELASALSFTLSGQAPDAELFDAAAKGELQDAAVREYHARRLLGRSETRHHFRRFVLEWLEVDRLEQLTKDAQRFPNFDASKAALLDETARLSDRVFMQGGASARGFLSSGPNPTRPGVLQQASVLAAHAHPDQTSPVKRGDFILRQFLCVELPRPAELGLEVVMPVAQANETAQQRAARHSSDEQCRRCHRKIDPLGLSFEDFDASGAAVVRSKEAAPRWNFAGAARSFEDSIALSDWLAQQTSVESCFARQAFRYFSASHADASEEAFLSLRDAVEIEQRTNLIELLVAYARSELFVQRGAVL